MCFLEVYDPKLVGSLKKESKRRIKDKTNSNRLLQLRTQFTNGAKLVLLGIQQSLLGLWQEIKLLLALLSNLLSLILVGLNRMKRT